MCVWDDHQFVDRSRASRRPFVLRQKVERPAKDVLDDGTFNRIRPEWQE